MFLGLPDPHSDHPLVRGSENPDPDPDPYQMLRIRNTGIYLQKLTLTKLCEIFL
jgi:hypothetical protein